MQELYENYLICQNRMAAATGLSKLLNGKISHDQVTKFLAKKSYNSKDLWKKVKTPILKSGKKEAGVLILDDTISEKNYSKETDINCWHYDHAKGRHTKGINLLTCMYSNSELCFLLDII